MVVSGINDICGGGGGMAERERWEGVLKQVRNKIYNSTVQSVRELFLLLVLYTDSTVSSETTRETILQDVQEIYCDCNVKAIN